MTHEQKSEAAKREEEILKFWQENDIFQKTLEKDSPQGEYVFYDGPPFANGLPHYGHIVASVMKDAVPRYFTMRGYHVPRRWGWDCHGLPVENEVEKELGFKSKKEIEEYGVAKFNEACRASVLKYADEWKEIIPRIGRWADMDNPYTTMDKGFMESVWWVFKELWSKGLVYEDYASMHVCPRCETTLSQQEVAEGYTEIIDLSVTAKFKIKNPERLNLSGDVYLLAWTTTPWTLPGNVALAVGEDVEYEVVKVCDGEVYILAEDALKSGGDFQMYGELFYEREIIDNKKGSELVELEYEPLFDYYANDTLLENHERGWKVYAADFVSTDEGTGIVHIAPAFGDEDMQLGKKENLPFVQHVTGDGRFKKEVSDFAGLHVKPKDDVQKTDIKIVKHLAHAGKLFSKQKITHTYPLCWRCDTPLLNYATSSWFVSVTKVKDELLKNAKAINWSPAHIKEGRFGHWLEGARDWSVSRQRFWASVMPIWKCGKCEEVQVFGSVAELEEASGAKVDDLHKHVVDEIVVPCSCGGKAKRVPDVLDTWFDSGSMPYAQAHYPFENKEHFEKTFPAHFIAEGIDQTRAWFYYLHVLGGALFNTHAFQNVIVNGVVLAEGGKKMSKKLKNYPDPMDVVNRYGADALRLYLLSSPIVRAENLNFSEQGVDEVAKKTIGRLMNVLSFYKLYADGAHADAQSENVLDVWIISRLHMCTVGVAEAMEAYELDRASRQLGEFVDDFSTWFVRRSRERIKAGGDDAAAALATLRYTLLTFAKVAAPFTPFVAEYIWREIGGDKESVHLVSWPEQEEIRLNEDVLKKMATVRTVVSLALEQRAEKGIKVRQPLAKLSSKHVLDSGYIELVKDEINVKAVVVDESLTEEVTLDTEITPELEEEGQVREFIRAVQQLRKKRDLQPNEKVTLAVSENVRELVEKHQEEIKKVASLSDIAFGEVVEGAEVKLGSAEVRIAIH